MAEMVKNHQQFRRCRFNPWVGKDSLDKGMAISYSYIQYFCQEQRSQAGYGTCSRKTSDTTKHTYTVFKNSGITIFFPVKVY